MLPKLPETLPAKLQDMPPEAARFCLGIKKSLDGLVKDFSEKRHGLSLLLAVSGGADSVSMLSAFACLSASYDISFEVCHVDHGLRPEAREEAAWVAALCRKMHAPCHMRGANVRKYARARGMGLEEAGRFLRYEALEAVRKKQGLRCIALAHTANDLAEDILMRLIRGAGWPALGGMPAYDEKRNIIRPLLSTPRSRIEHFLDAIGLPFLKDPSNQDLSFFRNRIRHTLMPLFLRENPKFIEHMTELRLQAEQDQKFWEDFLPEPDSFLCRSTLDGMTESARFRLYKRQVENMGCHPTASALKTLDRAYQSGKGGLCVKFAGKGQAHVKAKGIVFIPSERIPE